MKKKHTSSPQTPRTKNTSSGKLSEAELLYRAMFEQSPDGILIIDSDGGLIDFNEAAHRRLGYTRDEFKKLSIKDIDPFQTPEEIQESLREALLRGRADFEVRHRTKNGEIRNVHVIATVIELSGKRVFQTLWRDITARKNDEETLQAYRLYLENLLKKQTAELTDLSEQLQKDIAERRKAENALAESEKRYRMLFESARDGILMLESDGDNAGRIIAANRAAAEMHGYAVDELLTHTVMELVTPGASEGIREKIGRIRNGEWVKTEIPCRRKNGDPFSAEISAGLLELDTRKYVFVFCRDTTERRRVEEEREKLIHELREALANIKTLRGLLPICAWCNKIRDDGGYWKRVETYIQDHSDALFTHGICPECLKTVDPQTYEEAHVQHDHPAGFMREKRQHERRPFSGASHSIFPLNGSRRKKTGVRSTVENISDGGVCIRTDYLLNSGDMLIFHDGTSEKKGVVRWKTLDAASENMFRVGIMFTQD